MRRIIETVDDIMRDETRLCGFPLTYLLWMISIIYSCGIRLRGCLYKNGLFKTKQLPCKVISIGNITVGGTGKTPMSMFVAETIQQLGYQVAVISRGYKGGAEKTGGIVSDGRSVFMTPDQAGDEPYLMATKLKNIPVLVGKDRFQAGHQAVDKFQSNVIVLDDAFQHLRLKRNLNLLLFDCASPFGNRYLIPRGPLREPLSALLRADAFILTRSDKPKSHLLDRLHHMDHLPVFKSFHEPYLYKAVAETSGDRQPSLHHLTSVDGKHIEKQNVFAFSGIASHEDFLKTIDFFDCNVVGHLKFPDHHRYRNQDLKKICHMSSNAAASILLTTEKDYVRITDRFLPLSLDLVVVGIKTAFGPDTKPFIDFLRYHLEIS